MHLNSFFMCLITFSAPFQPGHKSLEIYCKYEHLLHLFTGHFIRHALLVLLVHFSFRTASVLRGKDSTKCSSEILLHIDITASGCRFTGCMFMIPVVLYCLVAVESIWIHWTRWDVEETNLRWSEFCHMVHYPARSSRQKKSAPFLNGWRWSAAILWQAVEFKWRSAGTKGLISLARKYPHTMTLPPAWIMLFIPHCDYLNVASESVLQSCLFQFW